jgi:hypothetical protein
MDKQKEGFMKWVGASERYKSILYCAPSIVEDALGDDFEIWQAAQKAAVPDGWQLVPIKPTEDMLTNVDEYVGGSCYSCSQDKASRYDCLKVWTSMIEAAPKP